MKLDRFFSLILKYGIQADPRKDKRNIKSFADSAILYGSGSEDIKKILVGIDIEVPELVLADRLRDKQGIDLVLAHHPEGGPFANLANVMGLQVSVLNKVGIRESTAAEFVKERQREVQRRLLVQNHMRTTDAARLLDMPLICAHTPADNQVYSYLSGLFIREKPKKLEDILDILNGIDEYKLAKINFSGPEIILGSPKRQAGKILVEMTGGTEGHQNIYKSLSKAGVQTLVCMHLSEEHFKNAKAENMNVIIAGHISSDVLGLNLLLDKIEKVEKLSILGCSGFNRIRRY